MLARNFIAKEDLSLYKIVHSAEEATAWIKSYYSTYNSIRQVNSHLVIRLEKQLSDDHISCLMGWYYDADVIYQNRKDTYNDQRIFNGFDLTH